MKKMKADPHYNVVQVKYAYAITCHKAPGADKWMNVFLDIGYMTEEMLEKISTGGSIPLHPCHPSAVSG